MVTRQANQSVAAGHGSYQPPDRANCPATQWEIPYDDAGTAQLQFLLWRHGRPIVDFVVNVQALGAGGWEIVEYFDCCHGHCHLHARNSEDRQTILRFDGVDDVSRAFVLVDQDARHRARILRNEEAP